jgi:hypothetical protein
MLIPVITELLAGGGLSKLLEAFKAKGMSAQADSWVGTGENQPISAADVKEVVGQEKIAEVAKQANISEDQAADVLAQAIPAAVDHVTPEGDVPDNFEDRREAPGGDPHQLTRGLLRLPPRPRRRTRAPTITPCVVRSLESTVSRSGLAFPLGSIVVSEEEGPCAGRCSSLVRPRQVAP